MIDRRTLLASSLVAGAGLAAAHAGAQPAPEPLAPAGAPDLRYAFSLSIFFKERIRIASPSGRVFVPVVGGEIWGPRLQGKVIPYGGADYAGGHGLDASYALQAADGAIIYIHNRGYMKRLGGGAGFRREPPPRKPGEVPDQTFVAPPDSEVPLRMRLTPMFDAPVGPHQWMSQTVLVGHGQRYTGPDHTIFTYYEVL